MGEVFIDGRGNYNPAGSEYIAGVSADNMLLVAGSISSIPNISASSSSDYKVSGTWQGIGSAALVAGNFNGSVYPLIVQGGSNLLVIGSVRQLTDPWIVLGSTQITNPSVIGSFTTQTITGSVAVTTGSLNIYGNISTSNPSVYEISGILSDVGSLSLVGAHYNGSAWALRMTAGSNLLVQIGNANTGSMHVIGSIGVYGQGLGSVHTIGSIGVYGQNTLGSVHNIGSIGVYGQATLGSLHLIGSIGIYGLTGSVHNIGSIGVYGQNTLGSIHTIGSIGVYGQATIGSVHTIGSIGIYGAGSVRQVEEPWKTEQIRGIFRLSGISLAGSMTGSSFITPGAGSKLFLKGFTASAEVATKFRLIFSGGTSTEIGCWSLPNSGTTAINLIGMEPSGATNQPLFMGLFNAGSIDITAFTRDTL